MRNQVCSRYLPQKLFLSIKILFILEGLEFKNKFNHILVKYTFSASDEILDYQIVKMPSCSSSSNHIIFLGEGKEEMKLRDRKWNLYSGKTMTYTTTHSTRTLKQTKKSWKIWKVKQTRRNQLFFRVPYNKCTMTQLINSVCGFFFAVLAISLIIRKHTFYSRTSSSPVFWLYNSIMSTNAFFNVDALTLLIVPIFSLHFFRERENFNNNLAILKIWDQCRKLMKFQVTH